MNPFPRQVAPLRDPDGKLVMVELYERPSRSQPTWHWNQLFVMVDGDRVPVSDAVPLEMN
jgi:hypothetical protein